MSEIVGFKNRYEGSFHMMGLARHVKNALRGQTSVIIARSAMYMQGKVQLCPGRAWHTV